MVRFRFVVAVAIGVFGPLCCVYVLCAWARQRIYSAFAGQCMGAFSQHRHGGFGSSKSSLNDGSLCYPVCYRYVVVFVPVQTSISMLKQRFCNTTRLIVFVWERDLV